ncbi:MAG: T9SS type A sorting domain-containing protein, partial [Fidelibacterota bacterium]
SLSMEFNMIWFEEQVITQDTVEISSEVIGDTLIVTYVIESDTVLRTTSRKGGSLSFDYVDATGRRFDSSTPGSSVSMKVFYNGPDGSLRVNMSGRLYGVGLSNFDFVIVKVVLNRDDFSGSFVVSHLNYKGEPLQPYWRLINKTEDEIKVMSHTDITSGTELSIIDGFQLTVTDGSFDFPSRSQWWEQTVDADGDTLTKTIYRGEAGTWSEFLGSIGISGGSHDQTQLQKDIRFVFTDEPARGYYWDGSSTAVELRDVPFEVWTVEDSTRINVLVWVLRAGQEVIHYEDDLIDPATGEILGTVGRLWNGIVVPIYEPYSTSAYYSPWGEGSESLGWVMQFGFKETAFVPGDEAVVHFTNPIFPGIDIYTFTASGLEAASGDQVRDQLSALNVFPNPYFGNNPEETNLSGRFVTFTHLGAGHHVIRIFTLSGTLVKKIEQENMDENDPSNLIRWDLQNSAGNPVASGMYIAHVQSETKTGKYERVLKLAVFQPAKPIGVR